MFTNSISKMSFETRLVAGTLMLAVAFLSAPFFAGAEDGVEPASQDPEVQEVVKVAEVNGTEYETIHAAISAATEGNTVVLLTDIELDKQVTIKKSINLDGAGFTLTHNYEWTENGIDNSIIGVIDTQNVSIKDITVNGINKKTKQHGVNIFNSSNVSLTNVNIVNNNQSGLTVNKSSVNVDGLTTSGNAWGAVNVDVTGAEFTLVNGSLSETNQIWSDGKNGYGIVDASGFNEYVVFAQSSSKKIWTDRDLVNNAYIVRGDTITIYPSIASAIENAGVDEVVKLSKGEFVGDITINKSVTITGNSSEIKGYVLITASDVALNNLVVGGNADKHGIQVWKATGVTLNDVTVQNNGKSGLLVNGSTVTVNNLTTKNNGWNGVNVDRGVNVETEAKLTINGKSTHSDAEGKPAIWIDDKAKTDVFVVDTNSQYNKTEVGAGFEYNLKPAPVNNGGGSTGGSRGGSRATTVETTTIPEGQVLGEATSAVSSFKFNVDLGVGSTHSDVVELQKVLIAKGLLNIEAPTGYFGTMTEAAVRTYQTSKGISATGFFGPLTRAAMNAETVISTTDEAALRALLEAAIKRLQELLGQTN